MTFCLYVSLMYSTIWVHVVVSTFLWGRSKWHIRICLNFQMSWFRIIITRSIKVQFRFFDFSSVNIRVSHLFPWSRPSGSSVLERLGLCQLCGVQEWWKLWECNSGCLEPCPKATRMTLLYLWASYLGKCGCQSSSLKCKVVCHASNRN